MRNVGVKLRSFLKRLQNLLLAMLGLFRVHLRVMKGHIPVIRQPIAVIVLGRRVHATDDELTLISRLSVKPGDEPFYLWKPASGA